LQEKKYPDAIAELAALSELLLVEREEDRTQHLAWLDNAGVHERVRNGISWFPLKIHETGFGLGAYPFIVVEKTTRSGAEGHFQSGAPVSLFSLADSTEVRRIQGTIGYADESRMKISFQLDELPDWIDDGKLGVDRLFDTRTYDVMFQTLNELINVTKGRPRELRDRILGYEETQSRKVEGLLISELNASQIDAVHCIASQEDIAIVHGPPGTGKTTTLVAAVEWLANQGNKILICAPSNAATDHFARSVNAKGVRVIRLGNLAKVEEEATALTLDVLLQRNKEYNAVGDLKKRAAELRRMAGKYKRKFGREEAEQRKLLLNEAKNINREARETEQYLIDKMLDDAQVIAVTYIGAAMDTLKARHFDIVFLDEAGQSMEPAAWVPIMKADKVVIAGDPYQLPPVVKSTRAAAKGLEVSLLEKIIHRQPRVSLLRTQYRMHNDIMQFSNNEFYKGLLESGEKNKNWLLLEGDAAFEFIDTAGCAFDEEQGDEGSSLQNEQEAQVLLKHLTQMMPQLKRASVGVISPYRAQTELLKRKLREHFNITVNTVDAFQGQERDVIYISLVRSNDRQEIGFLKDYRRMNVAMTRARKKLVIIGDSATFGNDAFYNRLMSYIEKSAQYRTAWEFSDY